MSNTLIRDFIQVKNQPTVVQLSDLEKEGCSWISENFYLSEGIQNHLKVVHHHIKQPHGIGCFLIGHYGSGKSHFLAYLAQQLGKVGAQAPKPVPISLLNYKADIPLENIVEHSVDSKAKASDRRHLWKAIDKENPSGYFLLLDELSEFLRSKPSPQSFNEDIRFLQFLGEWAQDHKLWILCAMQEQIEHTGAIEGDLYKKIKDRFPVRLLLTPIHLKDFIGNGLLIKGPGFENAIENWFRGLKGAFSGLKLDFNELSLTYPLHPIVLDILEEIRDQFSQARGVVDFTVKQLLGDPAKESAPFLDRPFGDLLTADTIIDHFQDLFELQPEFQTLSQKVLPFYRRKMIELFPNEAQRNMAWKLLHLLMLVHLSPRRQVLSAKDATWWLLHKISQIDTEKNEQILRGILEKLTEEGAFVQKRGSGFFLNLSDDSKQNLDRLLEKAVKELKSQGERVFEKVAPLLDASPFSPFVFKEGMWNNFTIRWHHHERTISVFIGGGEIKSVDSENIHLQVGLPWGPLPSHLPCVIPKPIELSEEIFELAALAQLKERPLAETVRKRIEQMLFSRQTVYFQKVQLAYDQAVLSYADGYRESIRLPEQQKTFQDWLSRCGEKCLKRKYPQFDRYAPTYGPLPAVAFQELMSFIQEHELTEEQAPEYVTIIREGYLSPMGLLQRRGRGYQTTQLTRHDLVNLVYQILPNRPNPKAVYEHLSQPVYGLVMDQIHCLLLFLHLEGEIEIIKGSRSYRECYIELPFPIQYDHLSTGRGLSQDQLNCLEKVCAGLQIEVPNRWGVLTQRRVANRLAKLGAEQTQRMSRLLLQIGEENLESIRSEVERLIQYWGAIEKGKDGVESLQHFLYEIETPGNFIALYKRLESLPERFEALSRESSRLSHLLNHSAVKHCEAINCALSELGPVPSLADPDRVQSWIEQSRRLYQNYCQLYKEAHHRFWELVLQRPIWSSKCPKMAFSSNITLSLKIDRWQKLRDRVKSERCTQLTSLDFQPLCACGFFNETAPILASLKDWEQALTEINDELRLYFQQDSVKNKVKQWWEEDPPSNGRDWEAVKNYLDARADFPDLEDMALLDQRLAGLETFQTVESETFVRFVVGKTWEREALKRDFSDWLSAFGPRIRWVDANTGTDRDAETLLRWATRQALDTGHALPLTLSMKMKTAISECLEIGWIKEAGLSRLEELFLGDKATDKILGWILREDLPLNLSKCQDSALCKIAFWLKHPPTFEAPEEWASAVRLAYSQNDRFIRLVPKEWLFFLDELANTKNEFQETLMAILANERSSQWLCIDGMGILAIAETQEALSKSFSAWRKDPLRYALVETPTSTDNFYHSLISRGFEKSIEKINEIDELVHSESSYTDFIGKVSGVLGATFRRLSRKLDPALPILVFSDHGFRISRDGHSLSHGGSSLLERVVPILKLLPRNE